MPRAPADITVTRFAGCMIYEVGTARSEARRSDYPRTGRRHRGTL